MSADSGALLQGFYQIKDSWQKLRRIVLEKYDVAGSAVKTNIAKGTTDPRVEFCLPKKQVLREAVKNVLADFAR